MSELLGKQVECAKREFEKNFLGSRELPQAHKKVCNENESRNNEKNDGCLNFFCWEEGVYKVQVWKAHVMDIK